MARTGRPRLPTAVKLAHGETRPSRINRQEPVPTAGVLRMPADMSDKAKRVWKRMLATAPPDLITAYDADLLRAYCETVVLYTDAVTLLAASQPLVRGARGNELVRNPLHQVVRDHRDAMRLLGRELGASPAVRSGLHVGSGPGQVQGVAAVLGPPPRERFRVVGGSDE